MDRPPFGRRGASQPARTQALSAPVARKERAAPIEIVATANLTSADAPSADEELRAWKEGRRFRVPWRQLCLMATICFGVASLVLPAGVSASVNWLLYGLTALSFYAWVTGRRTGAKS